MENNVVKYIRPLLIYATRTWYDEKTQNIKNNQKKREKYFKIIKLFVIVFGNAGISWHISVNKISTEKHINGLSFSVMLLMVSSSSSTTIITIIDFEKEI